MSDGEIFTAADLQAMDLSTPQRLEVARLTDAMLCILHLRSCRAGGRMARRTHGPLGLYPRPTRVRSPAFDAWGAVTASGIASG